MASSPIISWQKDGGNSGNTDKFNFWGIQNHCGWSLSQEIKRCLFLGRKVMTNLDSILKSMYGYESWTIRKAERQRIDAFELWCWSRLLSVPWTARRSNQSVLKEISPEYSLERLMLKLKLHTLATWCEELTHWKRPRFWERLKAGEGDDRGWDGWVESPTQWIWVWANSRRWLKTGKPGVLQSMGLQRVRHDWATEQQLLLMCIQG